MNLFARLFGQKPAQAVREVGEQATEAPPTTTASGRSASVKWTDAQLKFLSGFLKGGQFKADGRSYWSDVLGESPAKTVQCLIDAELLAPAPLVAKLESTFKVTEIKALLRERGLPVSGKKADAIARLVELDTSGMEAKVAKVSAYICTESGRELADAYLKREDEHRRRAREQTFELVCAGSLRQAWSAVAEYERTQVFVRGLGVNWSQRPSEEDLSRLKAILEARPTILKNVAESDWLSFQRAAAMMELFGERSGRAWLPEGFIGASNLDIETAIRMVLFAGDHHAKIQQFRRTGCSRVEVSGSGDASCPVCKKMGGNKHQISQVPELPHPDCTHEMGCRCLILPVFD